MQHEMITGGHGHGLSHCKYCLATDREIALVLGPVCPAERPAPPKADELVERLLRTERVNDPMTLKPRLINPDGPEAATTITRLTGANAAQAKEIEGLREALTPKPKGMDCPHSPTGFHIVDTSMESGCNNCFHCEADMRGYVPGAAMRPTQPVGEGSLWYRGWEAGYDDMAARYVKECWVAYKGGCDLDAHTITASSWNALLDEIDAEMEGTDNGD